MILTKQDTAVLKGIAIIAMLMHHLWGCPPEWVTPYTSFLGFFGGLGKVCVAIFLFCSGYGLSVEYSKIVDNAQCTMQSWTYRVLATLKFLAKRFVKFYAGYWPIFLIFVPMGVYFFGRPLSAAYGEHVNIIKRLLFDFIGVQGLNSYNIAWWFNQLIIVLYLLFPLLFFVVSKMRWVILMLGLLLMRYAHAVPSCINVVGICTWQLPFIVGIFLAQNISRFDRVKELITKYRCVCVLSSLIILTCFIILRCYSIIPHWSGIRMDTFVTISLAIVILCIDNKIPYVTQLFAFLGKHSMNIYMTHTFFFLYWFPTFLYSCELGGGMNIIVLLVICTVTSVAIEWLKKITRWNNLSTIILEKIDKL